MATKTTKTSTARRTVGTLRVAPNMSLKASECGLTQLIERAYYRINRDPTSKANARDNKRTCVGRSS